MLMRFFFLLLRGFSQGAQELKKGRSRDNPHGFSRASRPGGREHRAGLQLSLLPVALTGRLLPQGAAPASSSLGLEAGPGSTGLGAVPCPGASPPGLPQAQQRTHTHTHTEEPTRGKARGSQRGSRKNLQEPLSHLVSGAELWPLLCLPASQRAR
uniref:Uncharacterized protein n=1 Tax=Myotis myotis TaxID=51298 RepID=A0A7J7ZY68_MYOMY|nr:hypothetical protein mMyoMyo1_009591 [Myotis myotis]